MRRWNVLVTAHPGPGAVHELLAGLRAFGEFHATAFKYVCAGWVADQAALLDSLLEALQAHVHWAGRLGRVVPLALTFDFTLESLADELKTAVGSLAGGIDGGTYFVRVERRGMAESVHTAELEPLLAEHLCALMEAQGKSLRTSFTDPDYILAVETLDTQCGLALITRDLRRRYPFVRVR